MMAGSNKWKKRIMKIKGFFLQVYSHVLLRYTKWNGQRLCEDIAKRGVIQLHVGCGLVLLK
ncbi:MAG: hypothetical protein KAR31_02175, partial [Candidatus Omnitrophica bacterium]|nr:hypothetical protein [Candidatus Omnitrophota bacterium]